MSPEKARKNSEEFKQAVVQRALEQLRQDPKDPLDFELLDFLDDRYRNRAIRSRIREYIETADVCVADLTEVNPNVAFEYGFRLATGHPVIPMRRKGATLAFNFDDYQTAEYDLRKCEGAIEAIKRFIRQYCAVGNRAIDLASDRTTQTDRICRYIKEHQPKTIDIIQVSLLALRDRLLDAITELSEETVVRLLLLHEDAGTKYSIPTQSRYVTYTRWFVENLSTICRSRGRRSSPTVGLWFYRHEPSIAAVIVDKSLIQLGWYLRAPPSTHLSRRSAPKLVMYGHNQPGIVLTGPDDDQNLVSRENWDQTFAKTREHFISVLRSADEPKDTEITGPRRDKVRANWRRLKSTGS